MNSIRERRAAMNMTQPQLSALLRSIDPRIDAGMISRFEQELCYPTEAVLRGLEEVLQADRSELYSEMTLLTVPAPECEISPSTALLAQVVPVGRENAVKRAELATRLGVSDRKMRAWVSLACREGLVIINDQNGKGYYRSDDERDIKRQLDRTHRRAMSLLAREKYLRARLDARKG